MKPGKRINLESLTIASPENLGGRIELGSDERTGLPQIRFVDDSGSPRLVIGLAGKSEPEVLFLRKDGSQLLRIGQDGDGGFGLNVSYPSGQSALSAVIPDGEDIAINVRDSQGNVVWTCT